MLIFYEVEVVIFNKITVDEYFVVLCDKKIVISSTASAVLNTSLLAKVVSRHLCLKFGNSVPKADSVFTITIVELML